MGTFLLWFHGDTFNVVQHACLQSFVSSIIEQLKKERDRVEKQLSGLNAALTAFAGVYGGNQADA